MDVDWFAVPNGLVPQVDVEVAVLVLEFLGPVCLGYSTR